MNTELTTAPKPQPKVIHRLRRFTQIREGQSVFATHDQKFSLKSVPICRAFLRDVYAGVFICGEEEFPIVAVNWAA